MAFKHNHALVQKGISYKAYQAEVARQISSPSTEEGELKLLPFKVKNLEIMQQLDKQITISEAFLDALNKAPKMTWLVITEGWCGDAAYIVPILAAAQNQNPEKVDLKFYFRDQNPEFMDAHLTNGGRSIPKLVILDENLKVLNTWGPRPEKLQQQMDIWKEQGMQLKQLIPKVAEWYKNDATQSSQQELIQLLSHI